MARPPARPAPSRRRQAPALARARDSPRYILSLNAANTRIRESNDELGQANKETSHARDLANKRARDVSLTTIDLAAQRGDWATAVRLLDELVAEAPDPSAPDIPELRFKRLRPLELWGASDRGRDEVLALSADTAGASQFAGLMKFWQAETADRSDAAAVPALYAEAIAAGLPPAEHHFAGAMVATRLPECREQLEATLKADPFHPKAVPMMAMLDLMTGRHEAARDRLEAGTLVFPSDGSYPLLLALQAGLLGDKEALDTHLERAGKLMDPAAIPATRRALDFMRQAVNAGPKLLLSEPLENEGGLMFQLMLMGGHLADRIIRDAPEVTEFRLHRLRFEQAAGSELAVVAAARELLELDPGNGVARKALEQLGETAQLPEPPA